MARFPMVDFLGQTAILQQDPDPDDKGDFRQVPASDRGNASYADRGQLGSWSIREPFRDPPGVKHFTGFGATAEDLNRGYVVPVIREDAAYDLDNYKQRLTIARAPDEDTVGALPDRGDYEFRRRGERARGFLSRPHIPVDR